MRVRRRDRLGRRVRAVPGEAPRARGRFRGAGAARGCAADRARRSRLPGEAARRRDAAFFEPRLGLDLGGVRIHDDALAARSADAVGARAYTVGEDVAFAAGRYAPHGGEGRALLAHELVHVAQLTTSFGARGRATGRLRSPPRRFRRPSAAPT